MIDRSLPLIIRRVMDDFRASLRSEKRENHAMDMHRCRRALRTTQRTFIAHPSTVRFELATRRT